MSMGMDNSLSGTWPARFAIVALIAGVGYGGYRLFLRPRWEAVEKFAVRLEEWNAINYPATRDSVPEGEIPYRTGRVFVIRIGRGTRVFDDFHLPLGPSIHEVWHRLGDDVRARTPEETGTLILTGPATLSRERTTYANEGGQTTVQVEQAARTVPLWVFDLNRELLIGTYGFEIPDGDDYEKPLKRFIETMPVR